MARGPEFPAFLSKAALLADMGCDPKTAKVTQPVTNIESPISLTVIGLFWMMVGRQTDAERAEGTTLEKNHVGFSCSDAERLARDVVIPLGGRIEKVDNPSPGPGKPKELKVLHWPAPDQAQWTPELLGVVQSILPKYRRQLGELRREEYFRQNPDERVRLACFFAGPQSRTGVGDPRSML